MSKRKRRGARSAPWPSVTLLTGLAETEQLMEEERWVEARERLDALDRRFPRQPDVLVFLVNVCLELGDMEGYQAACERLLEVDPENADAVLGLAGACLGNLRPSLARQAFRRFLERWPDHERAADARRTLALLEEELLPEMLSELNVPPEDAAEISLQQETIGSRLAQARFGEAQRLAEALLRQYPHFAPVLNNLSLVQWALGRLDDAARTAERALETEPDNIHALSNLVHYLCCQGRVDEAATYADRLRSSTAKASQAWLKKIEGLSFLGADEAVLEVFRQAEEEGILEDPTQNPGFLLHLAAVAELRLGREDEARQHWLEAVKAAPALEMARENLDDLAKPVGERHAPWPFPLNNWLTSTALQDLVRLAESFATHAGQEEATQRALRRYLRKHHEVPALVPILLDRGDPEGRQFAFLLARTLGTAELAADLRDFGLSQRGPDALRLQALQVADEAGLLPAGPVRMWIAGAWTQQILMNFEIYDEPEHGHSPQVAEWLENAVLALRERDTERAEPLLRQALAEEPEAPDILNNLAVVYELQGRTQEARALCEQLHERHPDYLFARVSLARLAMQKRKFDRAHELLDPLLERKRLHASEFEALCAAQAELLAAEGKLEGARSWVTLLESILPDSPLLDGLTRRMQLLSAKQTLLDTIMRVRRPRR